MRQAVAHISRADMLIVGGTSLVVYPAAGMIDYFRGEHLVLINRAPTASDKKASLLIPDSIGTVLGQISV
jgi:NAD-dependent deacetylase